MLDNLDRRNAVILARELVGKGTVQVQSSKRRRGSKIGRIDVNPFDFIVIVGKPLKKSPGARAQIDNSCWWPKKTFQEVESPFVKTFDRMNPNSLVIDHLSFSLRLFRFGH